MALPEAGLHRLGDLVDTPCIAVCPGATGGHDHCVA